MKNMTHQVLVLIWGNGNPNTSGGPLEGNLAVTCELKDVYVLWPVIDTSWSIFQRNGGTCTHERRCLEIIIASVCSGKNMETS